MAGKDLLCATNNSEKLFNKHSRNSYVATLAVASTVVEGFVGVEPQLLVFIEEASDVSRL